MPRAARFLLDTNAWSYVADEAMLPDMLQACRNKRIVFMVAPASVAEARELGNAEIRKRILSVMTHERWTRLMPDAYLEAQEIKAAILSLRPQWASTEKNFKDFNKVRYDWLRQNGGFWERARKDIQLTPTDESLRGQIENRLAQQQVRDIRDMFKERNQSGALTHLQSVIIEPNGSISGMTTVDYWRLTSSYILLKELQIYASPYREWLDCEVDIHALSADMEDFENMWFRELRPDQVKRQWLRGSMEFLQRWHKPSDGSPVDSQLTSHLIDADYFVTADKNFARCVERIHAEAPFVTGKPLKIPAGRDGINDLMTFIRSVA